jgi:SAM-dependent methyltransferase
MKFNNICSVCGGKEFAHVQVLWQGLIDEWELTQKEVDYVNRQQGMHCMQCKNNLRSISLADAMLSNYQFSGVLKEFSSSDAAASLKLLEINEAGSLSTVLANVPGHMLVRYPDFDMMNLALPDDTFDAVVHSDTLEHIPDPILALSECRRVLKPGGVCIFTVPIIVGRKTRSRSGMPKSYHGSENDTSRDLLVHYEFGTDIWEFAARSGFKSITTHILEYPAAMAIIVKKRELE